MLPYPLHFLDGPTRMCRMLPYPCWPMHPPTLSRLTLVPSESVIFMPEMGNVSGDGSPGCRPMTCQCTDTHLSATTARAGTRKGRWTALIFCQTSNALPSMRVSRTGARGWQFR
jgi:hypothetical protein